MELMDYILVTAVVGFLFFFSNATLTIENNESNFVEVKKNYKNLSNTDNETFKDNTILVWPNIKPQNKNK